MRSRYYLSTICTFSSLSLFLHPVSAKLVNTGAHGDLDVLNTDGGEMQLVLDMATKGPSQDFQQLEAAQSHHHVASASTCTVALPSVNASKSFWLDTPGANPLADVGSTGDLTGDADICIVGSGITGVSAAWHLAHNLKGREAKARVVILEARQFCSGATGRNGGHLTRNMFSKFLPRQAKHGTSEAIKSYLIEKYTSESLVRFLKERELEETVDLVEGGHIAIFRTKEEEEYARENFAAAAAAEMDLGGVRWVESTELHEKYGVNPEFNFTGVTFTSYNLWPSKLVTELFKDAQTISDDVDVLLHTKTPVNSITRRPRHLSRRPWAVHTPRGDISCSYVIHATNAYAGHLLPFYAGSNEKQASSKALDLGGYEPPPPARLGEASSGITPTRGQVGSIRASVSSKELRWRNSWDGGGGGWEYWFPRYQGVGAHEAPLIILGGGRQHSGGNLESGVTDDSCVNPRVGKALRHFLPDFFPGKFDQFEVEDWDPWEMEWTGIMGYTKSGDPLVGPVILPRQPTGEASPYEGQYIAAGYTGHGMPMAYACAEVVAGMIAAKITGDNWTIPEWFPKRYLTYDVRV